MNKGERKLILVQLMLIIIFSCFLVYKIKSEPKYDEGLYSEIYSEYEQLFEDNQVGLKGNNDLNNNKKDSTIYLSVDSSGNRFRVVGKITIPKINVHYPIIYETSEEYLKIAPTKLFGPNINEVGNLCIVGHNYKNNQFFSKLSELDIGDKVYLTPNKGNEMMYLVYDKYEIEETDMECTSQDTNGNIELTLITCTSRKKNRLVVKCKAKT